MTDDVLNGGLNRRQIGDLALIQNALCQRGIKIAQARRVIQRGIHHRFSGHQGAQIRAQRVVFVDAGSGKGCGGR